jgi:hypothetical protein
MLIDLKDIGCEDMHCIHLAQDRVEWWDIVSRI